MRSLRSEPAAIPDSGPRRPHARTAGLVRALALTVAGYQVGHPGGRLVYGDGTTPGLVAGPRAGMGDNQETAQRLAMPEAEREEKGHD